eukprot:Rhum_TRINITY_DN14711_c13_g1::Rhum_TRINITY_DN14711_c13_g1_i1::g.111676::m.111676
MRGGEVTTRFVRVCVRVCVLFCFLQHASSRHAGHRLGSRQRRLLRDPRKERPVVGGDARGGCGSLVHAAEGRSVALLLLDLAFPTPVLLLNHLGEGGRDRDVDVAALRSRLRRLVEHAVHVLPCLLREDLALADGAHARVVELDPPAHTVLRPRVQRVRKVVPAVAPDALVHDHGVEVVRVPLPPVHLRVRLADGAPVGRDVVLRALRGGGEASADGLEVGGGGGVEEVGAEGAVDLGGGALALREPALELLLLREAGAALVAGGVRVGLVDVAVEVEDGVEAERPVLRAHRARGQEEHQQVRQLAERLQRRLHRRALVLEVDRQLVQRAVDAHHAARHPHRRRRQRRRRAAARRTERRLLLFRSHARQQPQQRRCRPVLKRAALCEQVERAPQALCRARRRRQRRGGGGGGSRGLEGDGEGGAREGAAGLLAVAREVEGDEVQGALDAALGGGVLALPVHRDLDRLPVHQVLQLLHERPARRLVERLEAARQHVDEGVCELLRVVLSAVHEVRVALAHGLQDVLRVHARGGAALEVREDGLQPLDDAHLAGAVLGRAALHPLRRRVEHRLRELAAGEVRLQQAVHEAVLHDVEEAGVLRPRLAHQARRRRRQRGLKGASLVQRRRRARQRHGRRPRALRRQRREADRGGRREAGQRLGVRRRVRVAPGGRGGGGDGGGGGRSGFLLLLGLAEVAGHLQVFAEGAVRQDVAVARTVRVLSVVELDVGKHTLAVARGVLRVRQVLVRKLLVRDDVARQGKEVAKLHPLQKVVVDRVRVAALVLGLQAVELLHGALDVAVHAARVQAPPLVQQRQLGTHHAQHSSRLARHPARRRLRLRVLVGTRLEEVEGLALGVPAQLRTPQQLHGAEDGDDALVEGRVRHADVHGVARHHALQHALHVRQRAHDVGGVSLDGAVDARAEHAHVHLGRRVHVQVVPDVDVDVCDAALTARAARGAAAAADEYLVPFEGGRGGSCLLTHWCFGTCVGGGVSMKYRYC